MVKALELVGVMAIVVAYALFVWAPLTWWALTGKWEWMPLRDSKGGEKR